jgi:biopolymer transport protein ExbB/TolQ
MADYSYLYAVDCARRAAERAAAEAHRVLCRGTAGLQAITCLAPLLGAFGTAVLLIQFLKAQPGCDYGDCASGAAEAFVPIALSLPVAMFACCVLHAVQLQVERFDLEMRAAILGLFLRHR